MDTLPYEAQTALVSFIAALLIGGAVSLFGFPLIATLARHGIGFALRHRMAMALGASALGAGGAWWSGLLEGPASQVAALFI